MSKRTIKLTVFDPSPHELKEIQKETKALIAKNGIGSLKGLRINPFDLKLKQAAK